MTQILKLAADHGLDLEADSLQVNEAGLDYRVVFARARDGAEWVLRIPRRPDVAAKLDEERRILDFVGPRISVAVPKWEIASGQLIAYRRLPGEPGLTLDGDGQPIWHFDPSSPAFAGALGRLIAELQGVDREGAVQAGIPQSSMDQQRAQWRAHLETIQREFEVAPTRMAGWEAWLGDDALWPEGAAFTHGELYAAHILIETPGRIVGVLDWTTAKVSDPAIDFTYQRMMGPAAFDATVAAYLAAGGSPHPRLAERCAALAAAAPVLYAIFALQTGDPGHRETAAAQLVVGA